MRKTLFTIIIVMTALTVRAQKVTFASQGFERGVKSHIGLADTDDVLQTQTDTITQIDLSGQEISSVHDVAWLPNVKRLDLSNNTITDVRPLAELENLEWLSLKNNFLTDASLLTFTQAEKMTVNVSNNFIEDFTAFLLPGHCQFTMVGMNNQQIADAEEFDVFQLYASVDEKGHQSVTYRGLTNMPSSVTLSAGEQSEIATLDGTTYTISVEARGDQAVKVLISNGTYADSTYVVPVSFYPTTASEAITIETGLPEKYRIDNAGAQYGTVVIDGTKLNYTAPDERTPDVVAFSYYEGARFRGYGYVLAGLHMGDVNADGSVTITDAVGIVNKILGNPSAGFIERAADVNRDSNISITDAVGVVNIILGNGGGASAPQVEMEEPGQDVKPE